MLFGDGGGLSNVSGGGGFVGEVLVGNLGIQASTLANVIDITDGGVLVSRGNVQVSPGGFFIGDGGFLSNIATSAFSGGTVINELGVQAGLGSNVFVSKAQGVYILPPAMLYGDGGGLANIQATGIIGTLPGYQMQPAWDTPNTTHTVTWPDVYTHVRGSVDSLGYCIVYVSDLAGSAARQGSALVSVNKSDTETDVAVVWRHLNSGLSILNVSSDTRGLVVTTDAGCCVDITPALSTVMSPTISGNVIVDGWLAVRDGSNANVAVANSSGMFLSSNVLVNGCVQSGLSGLGPRIVQGVWDSPATTHTLAWTELCLIQTVIIIITVFW